MTENEMMEVTEKDLKLIILTLGYLLGALMLSILALVFFSLFHSVSILISSVIVLYFLLVFLSPSIYRKWQEIDKKRKENN